jgi:heat shock protein 1/8
MVREAEKFSKEDAAERERIGARNALESYTFSAKQSVEDEQAKNKISEADRNAVLSKCEETMRWVDANKTAGKDEYEYHQKELEKVCSPIITKLYQAAPSAGGCGAQARTGCGQNTSCGPTIEEVD